MAWRSLKARPTPRCSSGTGLSSAHVGQRRDLETETKRERHRHLCAVDFRTEREDNKETDTYNPSTNAHIISTHMYVYAQANGILLKQI